MRNSNISGKTGKCMYREIERRKQTRLQVKERAAAILDDSRIGIILDISKEGLSFRYVASPKEIETSTSPKRVSITHDDFTLTDIPCTIVNDRHLMENYSNLSSLNMYRCCLQFDEMAPNHKSHLDYFLANFTEQSASKE
jgi:hypothetical protein